MKRFTAPRARGFLLMELAIALLVIGGLVALLLPLWSAQGQIESARLDALRLQQVREALLRQAVVGAGLPAPLQFTVGAYGVASASSHSEIDSDLIALPLGFPGALPGHMLGVASVSPMLTAYWYDVQPALRSDAATGFYPLSSEGSAGEWSFESIVSQFDPDINTNISTGGNASQLCRNLNSLQAIEQSMRVNTGGTDLYRRDHINLTLPRIWSTGYETQFTWERAVGYAGVTDGTEDSVFDNSSAAAFVVVRRTPPALRRLDRQNTVYQQVALSGLDSVLDYTDPDTVVYPAFSAARGFRVYENPLTPAVDDPASDARDYAGRTEAVSLGEFADALRQAGVCTAEVDRCKANQLFVRFSNYVSSLPPSGDSERLTMRWQLADPFVAAPNDVVLSGDVSSGSVSNGVCLDAFSTDVATTAIKRELRILFISPAGSVGYADGGDAWYRGGVLVDPQGSPRPAADAGVTRWSNLSALSAAEAGKTLTISCTGSHTVTPAGATGQLVRAGPNLPSCTATLQP